MSVAPQELEWRVNGLRIAGQSWGDPGAAPLLALHGWLDNSASFARLAPLLPDYHLVALDLPGHGRSDWRSPDAGYHIWDDLPEVHAILEELAWERFDLLGHSRGAIISALFSSAFPERVNHLVMLDAVLPEPLAESAFPGQLASHIADKRRLVARRNRVFPNLEAAVAARQRGDMALDAAASLARRNLRDCEGGVTWTTDPRLRGASASKLTPGQGEAVLGALAMPVLLVLAERGLARMPSMGELAVSHIPGLRTERVDAGHHFHMDGDVQALATLIGGFLTQSPDTAS